MKTIRTLIALCALLAPALHGADFTNGGAITIFDNANASPYPSTVTVSGVTGPVTAVQVRITGFTHTYPIDVDVFLVAPSGAVAAVFSDAGDAIGSNASSVNLIFDDAAATVIPTGTPVTSGTFRPANYEPGEALPSGATGTIGTNLTALAAGGANGQWKLYVRDDSPPDTGTIASWTLSISTAFEVTNTNDAGPGSLRWAMANADAIAGADTVTFALALSGQTITLTSNETSLGAIVISSDVTVDASALASGVIISGGNVRRIFYLNSGSNVTLRGITLKAGNAAGNAPGNSDGALDADGDGSSNAAELGNQTSPRDSTSLLRIVAFTPAGFALDGDPRFDVTWTSFPGLSYTIEAKADLNFAVTPREADPVTATGFTHTLRIELDKNNPKDFIRVRRN